MDLSKIILSCPCGLGSNSMAHMIFYLTMCLILTMVLYISGTFQSYKRSNLHDLESDLQGHSMLNAIRQFTRLCDSHSGLIVTIDLSGNAWILQATNGFRDLDSDIQGTYRVALFGTVLTSCSLKNGVTFSL